MQIPLYNPSCVSIYSACSFTQFHTVKVFLKIYISKPSNELEESKRKAVLKRVKTAFY